MCERTEDSLGSGECCCEPKMALKDKAYLKNTKTKQNKYKQKMYLMGPMVD